MTKGLKQWIGRASTSTDAPSLEGKADDMFEYTSGRWMQVISCHRHWRRGPADVRFEPPADRLQIQRASEEEGKTSTF